MDELNSNFNRNMEDLGEERKMWEKKLNKNEEVIKDASMIQDNLKAYIWNAQFINDFSGEYNDEF